MIKMKKRGKKGMEMEMVIWFIIAVVVLAFILIAIFFMKGTGFGLVDKIKNIFRFGG